MSLFKGIYEEIKSEIEKEIKAQKDREKKFSELNEKMPKNVRDLITGTNKRDVRTTGSQRRKESDEARERAKRQQELKRELQRKRNQKSRDKDVFRGEDSIGDRSYSLMDQDEDFDSRYGKTNSFTDALYARRPKKVAEELKLETIEETGIIKKSKIQHEIGKKLKNKNAAREAFIHSIIFERKI